MGIPHPRPFLSVEDYLNGEPLSDVRHDYIHGDVYAMAGATANHNLISGNAFAALHAHLRGKPCRVFMADMKVRMLVQQRDVFYYPDVVVGCDERDTDPLFLRFPKLVIEVSSPSTERLDSHEKFFTYTTIPTLEEYVLIDQSRPAVTLFRRSNGWKLELIEDPTAIVELHSVGLSLPLAQFYENWNPAAV